MALSQLENPKHFARDIAAYSDAQLDEYLKNNGRIVTVEDPEALMNDEEFIQRLRARAGPVDVATSCQIDLNYVSARLMEPYSDGTTLSPSSSQATTPPPDPEKDQEEATRYYNALIMEGGRPSHPIGHGHDIAKDPGEYSEILSFWQNNPYHFSELVMFSSQLFLWQQFRERQRYMREQGRFPEYVRAVKDRLSRHGFERSFQLEENLDRQDKLATWIEFLNFEYRKYNVDARTVERHQSHFDEEWKKLADSKVLKPFENAESLQDIQFVFQLDNEEVEAENAVKSATSIVKSAEAALQEARYAGLSPKIISQTEQDLSEATCNLGAVIDSQELIHRRIDLTLNFRHQTELYRTATKDMNKRSKLLRWILQQIPLIEFELSSTNFAEKESNEENDQSRSSPRNRTDNLNQARFSERQTNGGESSTILERSTCVFTAQGPKGQLKLNRRHSMDGGRTTERPKSPSTAQGPKRRLKLHRRHSIDGGRITKQSGQFISAAQGPKSQLKLHRRHSIDGGRITKQLNRNARNHGISFHNTSDPSDPPLISALRMRAYSLP